MSRLQAFDMHVDQGENIHLVLSCDINVLRTISFLSNWISSLLHCYSKRNIRSCLVSMWQMGFPGQRSKEGAERIRAKDRTRNPSSSNINKGRKPAISSTPAIRLACYLKILVGCLGTGEHTDVQLFDFLFLRRSGIKVIFLLHRDWLRICAERIGHFLWGGLCKGLDGSGSLRQHISLRYTVCLQPSAQKFILFYSVSFVKVKWSIYRRFELVF